MELATISTDLFKFRDPWNKEEANRTKSFFKYL